MVTAISAPGKVLLAGGYLVLDRAYTGLVFGLSARIHVIIDDIGTRRGDDPSEIVVQSPQFRGAEWRYAHRQHTEDGGIQVTQLQSTDADSSPRNPFVETALSYALTYVASVSKCPLNSINVTILADNDYYSQPRTVQRSEHFIDFNVRLQDAHKTGLGSSAALVTAFTGAILTHYLPTDQFSLSSEIGRSQLHNLAQAAHCAAQGKVGSGFDVAAAVHGSCTYRRFSPSILTAIGEIGSKGFATQLSDCVREATPESRWDVEIVKDSVSLPTGTALIMCDVDCGSQTVGMVKKVLEWRKQDPEQSKVLWDRLQTANDGLAAGLSTQSNTGELTNSFEVIRRYIRQMGERSGVPIEPTEQTELLDMITAVEGVFGGVVPGAGGYDAIALLVKDDAETMSRVKHALSEWSASKSSNVKLLDVKGEMEGVRMEDVRIYARWLK